jgi:hypothetical protein
MSFYTAGHELTAAELAGIKDAQVAFTPVWSGGGAFAMGNGSATGTYWKVGNHAHLTIKLLYGSTTNQGTGLWNCSFAAASSAVQPAFTDARSAGNWTALDTSAGTRHQGQVYVVSTTNVQCIIDTDPSTVGIAGVGATNQPITWANGDTLVMDFWIPIL